MDLFDDVGPREAQCIEIAFEFTVVITESRAAKIFFRQVVRLQENAHRAVNDEYTLAGRLGEAGEDVFRHG